MNAEELEELEARLFASARGEPAPSAVREQTLSRMLAKRKKTGAARLVFVMAALAAALGVGLVVLLERSPEPSIGAERFSPERARESRDAAREQPPRPLVTTPDVPKQPETSRSVSPPKDKAPAPAPKPAVSSAAPLTLEEETSALQSVQAELRSGQPKAALALLDRYERAARDQHLAAEAQLLRIQALAASGRADAASKLAERFVRAYANSPLVDRARKYLPAVDAGGIEPNEEPRR